MHGQLAWWVGKDIRQNPHCSNSPCPPPSPPSSESRNTELMSWKGREYRSENSRHGRDYEERPRAEGEVGEGAHGQEFQFIFLISRTMGNNLSCC